MKDSLYGETRILRSTPSEFLIFLDIKPDGSVSNMEQIEVSRRRCRLRRATMAAKEVRSQNTEKARMRLLEYFQLFKYWLS